MHIPDCEASIPFAAAESVARDWVILLHGLFATRRSMRKLAERLANVGYSVLNWGYPTLWRSTTQHVDRLLPELYRLQADNGVRTINFVTHSMGGIVVRSALHSQDIPKVQRLVMLAPPNRGSHLTRVSLGPFAWSSPPIAELTEAPASPPNRLLISARVEVGVLAAARDVIVPVANTLLPNQRDHRILPTSHFRLPTHDGAILQVLSFLSSGEFLPAIGEFAVDTARARSAA